MSESKNTESIELILSVNEWNTILGAVSVLSFSEVADIVKTIAEQASGSEAKGSETISIKLSRDNTNQILGVLQLLPYHVSAVVISKVYDQATKQISDEKKTEESAKG